MIAGAVAVKEGAVTSADEIQFVPEDYFRRLRIEEIFPGRAERPLEVDLGCGDGGFLTAMAEHFPERNFLGVERLLGRVRKVCRKAARAELDNVRVLRLESGYTVEWLLPDACAARVHLLFPDPWPKKRHLRRRIVTGEFLGAIGRILVPGGEFVFKTDDAGYLEAVREALPWDAAFLPVEAAAEGEFYAATDFERQWRAEGREIGELRYRRREQSHNRGRSGGLDPRKSGR